MKKLIYTMTVSCLFFGLGSCDQEIDYPYEELKVKQSK